MTLIVARKIEEQIYIVGDTQLTLKYNLKNNPFFYGCLKQYIVNNNIAVAFAGNKDDFEEDLSRILKSDNSRDIVNIALHANKKYDLIIADLEDEELIFIKDGKLEKQDSGFIGDPTAYNFYQKNYHKFENNSEPGKISLATFLLPEPVSQDTQNTYKLMFQSLKEVCLNNTIQSVGGVIVPLCSHNKCFSYMSYMDSTLNSFDVKELQRQLITYGSSSDGSCTVEFFGNVKNPGYYFLQGGVGLIYSKNNYDLLEPKLVFATTPAHWALETAYLLGEGLKSGFLNVDNCGELGEALLKQEEYRKAIYCYELKVDSPELLGERKIICDRYIAGYAIALFNIGETKKAELLLIKWAGQIDNPMCINCVLKQIKIARN